MSINSQLERLALEYSASIREEDVTLKEQEEIMNSEWFIRWMKEYQQEIKVKINKSRGRNKHGNYKERWKNYRNRSRM